MNGFFSFFNGNEPMLNISMKVLTRYRKTMGILGIFFYLINCFLFKPVKWFVEHVVESACSVDKLTDFACGRFVVQAFL